MMIFSKTRVWLFLATLVSLSCATVTLVNPPTVVEVAKNYTLSWTSTGTGGVTIFLRKGYPNNILPVLTVGTGITTGKQGWITTFQLDPRNDYAFELSQGGVSNFHGPFAVVDLTASSSTTTTPTSTAQSTATTKSGATPLKSTATATATNTPEPGAKSAKRSPSAAIIAIIVVFVIVAIIAIIAVLYVQCWKRRNSIKSGQPVEADYYQKAELPDNSIPWDRSKAVQLDSAEVNELEGSPVQPYPAQGNTNVQSPNAQSGLAELSGTPGSPRI